jgi:hypothetical protein
MGAEAPKKDEPKQKIEVSNTQRIDFPADGTLRLKNSMGVLTVEAWDRPDVEITTVKSTIGEHPVSERDKELRKLDRVHVTAERRGNEVVVTTEFPWKRPFKAPYPLSGNPIIDLDYHIRVPANARVVADHKIGEVNIDGLGNDIQVTLDKGEILLHLPEDGRYNIQAKSDFGTVNSDFSEPARRTRLLLGHRSDSESSAAPHKLNLKVGFGDIVILKTRLPKAQDAAVPAPKAGGL